MKLDVSLTPELMESVSLDSIKELEELAGVWKWGKWALRGESTGTELRPQVIFLVRAKDPTAWDAVPEITDEEGLWIDNAMRVFDPVTKEVLRKLYMFWSSTHDVGPQMTPKILRGEVLRRRDRALSYLVGAQSMRLQQ